MSFSLSEYTKIDVGWGAPDPTGGAYSAPTDPLAGFKEEWMEGQEGGEREERGGWGRPERKGKMGSWGNSALLVGG